MGLDITAYRKLEYDHDSVVLTENKDFPDHAEGIDLGVPFKPAERFGFRAGSYSGYGQWRDDLALFAEGDAFSELINFSDCEGVIGPVVAKKLAADFKQFHDKALATGDEWFIQCYENWEKAFEMASDGGAVDFH